MKKINSRRKRIKRKNISQLLLIIPVIILIIISSQSVSAGTSDSILERNPQEGIYAIAPLSDKTHLYNLEMYKVNNKDAYCIEIGKKVTTTTYNSTSNNIEQEKITNLTSKQLEYLKLISYFGVSYIDHGDYRYYMAAQELIWEYLNNIDVNWTNTLDINGERVNIRAYKDLILRGIKEYTSKVSFNTIIDCKVGDTITLTDTNKSLSHYQISSSGNQDASITKNNLTINIDNNYIGKDKIILERKNFYDYQSTIYYNDNSQTLISAGNIEPASQTITLNITGETLTTSLVDKDTKTNIASGQATLSGAVYELYDKDNKLVTTFTTDSSGINTIRNLYHDKYYIKQIKASKGYKLNEEIYEIDLTSENNKLTLTEEVIKSTIEINKLYEIEDDYKREENIKFSIYDNKNNLYTSLTTTKIGPDKITLPYGIYTIKQENTTYGYDTIKDINLNIDENAETLIRYDLVNKKLTSKLHITTKDSLTNDNILESNIKYKIKDNSTDEYLTYIDINNNEVNEFSTQKSGELIIPIKLPYGIYTIEQITTPNGYLENKEPFKLIINDKSNYSYINNEVVINVDFPNDSILGKINIITKKETFVIEDNNYTTKLEKRDNIEIELYYNDELINNYKTDESGTLSIENLKLGNYCVKEVKNNNKECFKLTNIDNKTEVIEKNIELLEKLKTTNIILTNTDINKEPVTSSTIELYKDNKLINTSITNENGIIKITNLPKGLYCFKQTKVSEKYIISKEKLCFEIKDTNKDINLTLINDIKTTKIKIPNTLSNKKYYFLPVLSVLTIIGVVINKKKKTNHNN